jgi:hypothetical protein
MFSALTWQDWLGFGGAALMLLALFLHLFAPLADGRGKPRAVLGLLGALALMPIVVARFSPPLFFLLVAWVLLNAYRLLRRPPRA